MESIKLIFRRPLYYSKFKCSANKCKDNCCIGWEIDIDPYTLKKYMNTNGEFGKRLKENISNSSFILNQEERCPFLNSKNLCDVYTELGEDSLCQICTDHPRFYEWFGNIKEGGIGLCCEVSAKLIMSEDFSLTESIILEDESDYPNELLFNFLNDARQIIIKHLSTDHNFMNLIGCLISFTEKLQSCIDNEIYTTPKWESVIVLQYPDIKLILSLFTELEPINEDWIPYIHNSMKLADNFNGYRIEDEVYLRRIAIYFIYRYFLKGVFDGEILSKVKLSILSTWVIAYLWKCNAHSNFENMVEIAKDYSKEIEYCTENLEALYDAFYTKEFLSSNSLLGLFSLNNNNQ